MGLGGISIWQLLIVLVIILLIFGTKKLRNIGSDLGGAVKGFKDSMKDEESDQSEKPNSESVAHESEQEKAATEKSEEEPRP